MVFLFILLTFIVLNIILFFSKIQIEIQNFRFQSQTQRHINKDYVIIIKLYALNILPILKINITKTKLEKLKLQEKIKSIDLKLLDDNQKFDKRFFTAIKKLDLLIQKINLNISIGTENASLTSIIVPVVSTVIAILLRKKIKNLDNQKFTVNPIYQNQNLVNIYISGIFGIKISHIINVIYILNKKENKGVENYERASNRRAYGYSYE